MKKIFDIAGFLLVAMLFVAAMFLTQTFQEDLRANLDFGYMGMLFYVLLGIVATVVAPVSTVPLIPIATGLWGPILTGFLSITAWTIGAVIAFLLSRHYGQPLLKRYVNLEKVSQYENMFEEKHIFWHIIILRMLIPVDILSYAIGLFSTIKLSTYTLATMIGITPFAFILAYMPNLGTTEQIFGCVLIAIVALIGYLKFTRHKSNNKEEQK